eukprot:gene25320-10976_t
MDPAMGQTSAALGASDCAKGHVHAKPKAGDAVLFYSFHSNGTMDMASMHTGCPVIKGIKWGAPVWIHVDEFNQPGKCDDFHEECVRWAARGECTKNQGFMLGAGDSSTGMCRLSCKACSPCRGNDIECINGNRKEAGFLELNKEEMEWLGRSCGPALVSMSRPVGDALPRWRSVTL